MSIEDTLKDMQLTIHELSARIDKLERDSHPPVFKQEVYEELDARLQVIEAFYNNIKLITNNYKEID